MAELLLMPADEARITLEISYPEQDGKPVRPAEIEEFCKYCLSVKPAGDFGDRVDFDAFKLKPWLGHILILEDLWPENDFLYRMYGTKIVDAIGWDMTGQRVSDYEPAIQGYNLSLYRDCVQQRRLIFSINRREFGRFSGIWHRLVCPVKSDAQVQVVSCAYLVSKVERATESQG
jgi:hypothetical protein